MIKCVVKPSIKLYPVEQLKEDTVLKYENKETGISQKLENLTLTTRVKRKTDYDGRPSEEISTIITKFKVGDRLVFGIEEGWIYPPYKMMTAKEVVQEFKYLKEV